MEREGLGVAVGVRRPRARVTVEAATRRTCAARRAAHRPRSAGSRPSTATARAARRRRARPVRAARPAIVADPRPRGASRPRRARPGPSTSRDRRGADSRESRSDRRGAVRAARAPSAPCSCARSRSRRRVRARRSPRPSSGSTRGSSARSCSRAPWWSDAGRAARRRAAGSTASARSSRTATRSRRRVGPAPRARWSGRAPELLRLAARARGPVEPARRFGAARRATPTRIARTPRRSTASAQGPRGARDRRGGRRRGARAALRRPHLRSASPCCSPTANVWHLSTRFRGTPPRPRAPAPSTLVRRAASDAGRLRRRPPRSRARSSRELEPFDRGAMPGPVGWMDANGDGEWAIALRCAELRRRRARACSPGAGHRGGLRPRAPRSTRPTGSSARSSTRCAGDRLPPMAQEPDRPPRTRSS